MCWCNLLMVLLNNQGGSLPSFTADKTLIMVFSWRTHPTCYVPMYLSIHLVLHQYLSIIYLSIYRAALYFWINWTVSREKILK